MSVSKKGSIPTGWREQIIRPALPLKVGGFRPTNNPLANCFGDVRVELESEVWPTNEGKPLWPLCQLNLQSAPFVPENMKDIALLAFFISPDYFGLSDQIIETNETNPETGWFMRTYKTTDNLVPIKHIKHGSNLKPFEAVWDDSPSNDFPTYEYIPEDLEKQIGGDYHDQGNAKNIHKTKLGGWPSCIQSEPWWDYTPMGKEFEYAFQIDTEQKSLWQWGDGGTAYIARSKENPNCWTMDFQYF